MSTSDPIADMLTRIRNANIARLSFVLVPASRIKLAIAEILKREGFIADFEVLRSNQQRTIRITLKYGAGKRPVISGLKRVSKPGLRVYAGSKEVPRVYGGLGIAILSTPRGLMVGQQAWRQKAGGEILCYVW